MGKAIAFLTAIELDRKNTDIYKALKRGEINGLDFGLLTLRNEQLSNAGKRIAMLQRRDKLKTARKLHEDVIGTTGALMGVNMALEALDGCL